MFMKEEHTNQPYLEAAGGEGRQCPHVSYVECQPGGYSNGRSPGQQDFQQHTRKEKKYIVYTRIKRAGSSGCSIRTAKERGGHLRNGVQCVHL
jgi:hypothetical protein